jgi:phage protein D
MASASPIKAADVYVPACTIAVGTADRDILNTHGLAPTAVSVDLALSMSGTFRFSIPDTFDPERAEFLTKDKDKALDVLLPGARVWIKMGYGDSKAQKLLISGYITAVATGFSEGGSPTLEVSGVDSTYLLALGNKQWHAEKVTVLDMVSKIASANGMSAQVEGTAGTPATLGSNLQTDLAYLGELASEFSTTQQKFEFYARASTSGDKLHFGPRKVKSDPVATLTWGVELLSFEPEITLGEQVSEVVVHGWDEVAAKEILGKATREPGGSGGTSGGAALKKAFGKDAVLHLRYPVKTKQEADDRAASELARRAQSYVGGGGETFGLPDLLPDTTVKLKGLGSRFSKTFYVSKTVHQFDASGYRTRFTVERTAM